ncbi:TPA: hypothetical protein ACFP30_000100 [Neisseria oralis]
MTKLMILFAKGDDSDREPYISDGLPSLEKEYAADNLLLVKQWGLGAAKHFCFVDSGANKNRRL